MLSVLIVSYQFPPVGGAGVQRVAKLVKYLDGYDVRPTVLTAQNPSVPVVDESLLRDIPAHVNVVRTRTLEPSYAVKQAAWRAVADQKPPLMARARRALTSVAKQLLVPDPQILWQPTALPAFRRLCADADVVFISGPPFSQFTLALAATKPVVLDYRDEWSTYRTTYEMMGGSLAVRVGETLEPAVLRRAAFVTTATAEFRENLLAHYPFLDPARVVAIENGYDRDDFPSTLPTPPRDRYVLTYAGTVFALTSLRGLLGAIRRLHRDSPALGKLLDVQVIGRIVETELDSFAGMDELGVQRVGYVGHDEVVGRLAQSHEVLCVLDEVAGNERIYPAKIFELMHLGRPVLALTPTGALERLVKKLDLGAVIAPRDEAAIARHLAARLTAFADGKPPAAIAPSAATTAYDRQQQAGRFAKIFAAAARR